MKNVVLFDSIDTWTDLLPITYTRPVADIRIGILTIRNKWEQKLPGCRISCLTKDYLSEKFAPVIENENLFIASNICPNAALAEAVTQLAPGEALVKGGATIAFCGSLDELNAGKFAKTSDYAGEFTSINHLYDIFLLNGSELVADFKEITSGRKSAPLSKSCTVIGPEHLDDGTPAIFIEEGASAEAAVFNTTGGPVYLGKDAVIMEGSCIRAPFAACEHAQVNMGAKIYGATTLGPHCKVGGELNNVVMTGYSNKAHDGFLGNAVIGEWCNLGAGVNASNLKNNYQEIKLWNYRTHRFMKTGLQFCGLIMGDHSKAGINTMFNTATVIGVGVNIHGSGFPRNFVASFQEGGASGYTDVNLNEFFAIAERVMARRSLTLTETDREIFKSIFNIADNFK